LARNSCTVSGDSTVAVEKTVSCNSRHRTCRSRRWSEEKFWFTVSP